MFIGREAELRSLQEDLSKDRPQLVRILGRRRVGKSELLHQLLRGTPGLLLVVPETDQATALETLAAQLSAQLRQNVGPYRSFSDLFDDLETRVPRLVVLDEFQHAMELGVGVESEIQLRWDRRWKEHGPNLILCGSSIGMMQRLVRGRAPLFGRVLHHLHLRPLPYAHAREFHEGLSEEDRIRRYAVFGGVPYYQSLSVGGTLEQAVRRTLLRPQGALVEEPERILTQEFREPARYHGILQRLAQNPQGLGDLETSLRVPKGGLGWYLASLTRDVDLVRHEQPVLGKKRLGRYQLLDPFFRFYYRFVSERFDLVELGREDRLWELIEEGLESYVGRVFEDVVLQILAQAREVNGHVHRFDQIGRWWDRRGEEIDVVSAGPSEVWVGEVKWSDRDLGEDLVQRLLAKARLLPIPSPQAWRPFIVSRGELSRAAQALLERKGGFWLDLVGLQRLMAEQRRRERAGRS
ncbi:MAG: ATP-binding protein [Euryarchaeota archaeon]|nr:ATP-binding protein [Euryarchaeota archaeon]MDE1837925.1 ATP-binding protein [Euryarchaeota archaeon]MDE1880169.1 ATP-binding protein [Euryarchaeota archaeon]MDE2045386.1 ATP-binding protein [Thermoplasmata archaeon]